MSSTPKSQHHGRRLKKFLHPTSGKHVYVAHSPEEVESLKKKLAAEHGANEDFDILIHGSPEHIDALRESHSQHERRRQQLRQEHANVYDEFENVRSELDLLSTELHTITEHSVSLDANFSKYGYSAHLRTHNTPQGSSSPYDASHDHHEHHDWEAERYNTQSIPLFKKPVVRQYFHKGLLWRASETEEVASFELFFDLLYVGLLAVMGDTASEHATGDSLLRFAIAFILSWKIWGDLALIISSYETNDVFQRVCVLFVMACLFGFTTNVVESGHGTYTQMIGFYLATRLFTAVYYVVIYVFLPMLRPFLVMSIVAIIIPGALWIGSIFLEEPNRQALIWIAILLDLFGGNAAIVIVRGFQRVAPKVSHKVGGMFEFYPGINIEHKTARTDAFVALVFGYSVVSVLYQNNSELGLNGFYGKAILTLIQSFSLNWLYFEIDGGNLHQHAIRRYFLSSVIWNFMHLPFILTLTLAASSAARLVLAHDLASTPITALIPPFVGRSLEHPEPGIRWFYCAGLAIALASMGVISLTHVHKKLPNARLSKKLRLAVRGVVCLVILLLPLAGDRLDSLELIGTTTAMIASLVGLEVWGLGQKGDGFNGKKRPACRYEATVSKEEKKRVEAEGGSSDAPTTGDEEKGGLTATTTEKKDEATPVS